MRRAYLLVLIAHVALAQDTSDTNPVLANDTIYPVESLADDGKGAPDAKEVATLVDLRGELRTNGTALISQCQARSAKQPKDKTHAWMQKAVQAIFDAREAAIQRLEDLFPASGTDTYIADALILLMHLHQDQESTQGELDALTVADGDPCDLGEPSDGTRSDRGYYASSAGQVFVASFASDARVPDIELELVDLYDQQGWNDQATSVLEQLLCPGAGDADVERSLDNIDQQLGQRMYGGSTLDYATCTPSTALTADDQVSAWLRLAEYEKRSPGRRPAAISAEERAIAVPGTTPTTGSLWELANDYVDNGQRVDAIPLLDDVAAQSYADSSQVEVGDLAVAKTGEVLALLWRDSSLPKPDAALQLAEIYFNDARKGEPHVRGVYGALANALSDMGAYEQASTVAQYVVSEWPLHPAAPAAAQAWIDIETERGDRAAADDARRALIARFADGTDWAKANNNAAAVVVDDTRVALARSEFHAAMPLAQKGKKDADEIVAAHTALENVIDGSPSPGHVVEARLLLGELDAAIGDQDDAAAQFDAAAKVIPTDSPLYPTAVGDEVRAWEAVVAKQTLPAIPKDLANLIPTPMPDAVASLRNAYTAVFPTLERDDDLARTLLAEATLDLRFGKLDDAEGELRALLANYCFSDSTRQARDVLVALVKAKSGDAAAQQIATDVAARGCLDDAKAQAGRDAVLAADEAKARTLASKGDHAAAAKLLDAAYKQVSASSPHADDLLDLTAIEWEKAGQLGKAARLWNELDHNPALAQSALYKEMLQHRAQVLDRQLDWPRAAAAYQALAAAAKGKKDGAIATEATWRAAELLALDHAWLDRADLPGAISDFLQVARAGGAHAGEAWLRAADLARRAGKRDQLASIHAEWRKKHDDLSTAVQLEEDEANAADAAGDHKAAESHYKEVVTRGYDPQAGTRALSDAAIDAVAEARFWMDNAAIKADDALTHFKWGKSQADDTKLLDQGEQRLEKYASDLAEIGVDAPRWQVAGYVLSAQAMLTWIDAIASARPPDWVITQFSLQKSGGDYVEEMRKLLADQYAGIADELRRAIDAPRANGMEKWLRTAEQLLAEIASHTPEKGGLRTEVFVEGDQ